MEKCTYCERSSFTGGYARPEMCEKHFDLALLAGRLLRAGQAVTVRRLEQAYRDLPNEVRLKVSFGKKEIAGLAAQARRHGCRFAFATGGAERMLIGGTHGDTH